ncbi:MAG: adenylosuccinate synthase [Alphaproteobacteria bacterium PRO2]|nr:adenylosuccinate synthase [Alphaproteobacteria bacterium PRO2]
MTVTIVNGAQYGDEGKGKIVDYLGKHFDIGIRATAGDNAGHTVCVGDKTLKLRLLPSTILSTPTSIIADDVMVNPITLDREIQEFEAQGIDCKNKLLVSGNAHMVLPYHQKLDELNEMGANPIGTTKRGIGPAIADKANRTGIRLEECMDFQKLSERIKERVNQVNHQLQAQYGSQAALLNAEDILKQVLPSIEKIRPYIQNTVSFVHQALDENRSILIEGAQGSMNDLTYGTYPYVTSSRSISSGQLAGCGIGPTYVDEVLSIIKPYQTRVGIGPVMAELFGEAASHICEKGHEYGTNTGRQRRIMWFDSVVANHTRRINGTTSFALMKLDVLDEVEQIKICIAYKKGNEIIKSIPFQNDMDNYTPEYITMPGWRRPTIGISSYAALPLEAKAFIEKIQELTQTPIALISVGPERENTIEVNMPKALKPGQSPTIPKLENDISPTNE